MLLVHATENGIEHEEAMYKSLESRSTSQTRPVARNHIAANCPFARRRVEIEVCDWIRRVRNAVVSSRSVQVGQNWIQRSSIKFSVSPNHWVNLTTKIEFAKFIWNWVVEEHMKDTAKEGNSQGRKKESS